MEREIKKIKLTYRLHTSVRGRRRASRLADCIERRRRSNRQANRYTDLYKIVLKIIIRQTNFLF